MRTLRRKASLVGAFAFGALAVVALPDKAEALPSPGCLALIGGAYNINLAANGFNNAPGTFDLLKDERIIATVTNAEFAFWDVNTIPVMINTQNGSSEFLVPNDGMFNFDRSIQAPPPPLGDPGTTFTVTCIPVPDLPPPPPPPDPDPDPPVPPPPPPGLTGDQIDVRRRVFLSYNYFNSFSPEALPGSAAPPETDPLAECEKKLAAAIADYNEKVKKYQDALETADGLLILGASSSNVSEVLSNRRQEAAIASSRVSILESQCKRLKGEEDFTLVPDTGNSQTDDPPDPDGDLEELGDGESILYAPREGRLASNVPWPLEASAYGPGFTPTQNLSASGNHYLTLGGLPVNIWGRVKGTLYDGSLGRRGGSGQGVFGVVVGITPMVDLGVFGHIVAGKISSSTLNGELESVSGGIGAHMMIKMPSKLRFGVSGSHSWGRHDAVIAGGAGSFGSSHWTFDASLARPFQVQDFVVTPMALLTYNHVSLGAYTDSNGLSVPKSTDSTLAISAALTVAYPMEINGAFVKTISPRVNVRANYFAKRAATLQLSPMLTLESSAVTVEVTGGIAFALQNGGNLDLTVGATGLAGDIRGYTVRGTFRIPLN